MSKASARQRELRKQNRLLVRQEGLAERDVAKVMASLADELALRWMPGGLDALLQRVAEWEPSMAAALEKRIKQTALIFGGRTLDRLEAMIPKSYYPNLPIGQGPVRGRDEAGLELKSAREVFEASIIQWTRLRALEAATTVMGSAREAVRTVLQRAVDEGIGEAGMVALIKTDLKKRLTGWQAARIARTEIHTAANVGADEAARSTGLDMVKEWASAEDKRTRVSHANADGQEAGIDEPFTIGGAALMMPGDPDGPAKEIINCRCAILHHPIIGGEVIR